MKASGIIIPSRLSLLVAITCALAGTLQAADVLIPAGSVWRYLDNGSDQGTAWRGRAFNDSGWAFGPAELGYGDGDEATFVNGGPVGERFITTYFRHSFSLPDATRLTNLTVRLVRDDGGVVYLNGVEVFRSNMPTGPVGYLTPALTTVNVPGESTFFTTSFRPTNLVDGVNVIAVEIHQDRSSSSDISFNLELLGAGPPAPPRILRQPENLTVMEGNPAFFSVTATGGQPLSYQWEFNLSPISGETNSTLVLAALTSTNMGSYRVVVSNPVASVTSDKVFLTVIPPSIPPVVTEVSPLAAAVGATVTIRGANFHPEPQSNTVYFGAVKAVVAGGSTNELRVVVPAGGTYAPISITTAGLSARSRLPFNITFPSGNYFAGDSFRTNIVFETEFRPITPLIADVDGHGWPDLITVNTDSEMVSVYPNAGIAPLGGASLGAAVQYSVGASASDATAADLDGDGRLDLVILKPGVGVAILRNRSATENIDTNSFAPPVDFAVEGANALAVGDLDRDGKPDMAVSSGNNVLLFRNMAPVNGFNAGSLMPAGTLTLNGVPESLAIADLDGDGWPDLLAGSSFVSLTVWRHAGAAGPLAADSFAPAVSFPLSDSITPLAVGDLNGDGRLEVVAVQLNLSTVLVYPNVSAPGSFETNSLAPPVEFFAGFAPLSVAISDGDGDGRPDLWLSVQGSRNVQVLRNVSVGGSLNAFSFLPPAVYPTLENPFRLAVGDLDRDGKPDLAVMHPSLNAMTLFRNTISPQSAPVIVRPPQDVIVAEGGLATLSAIVGGTEPLSVRWQLDGVDLPGATNLVLTFDAVKGSDAGSYRVIANNTLGLAISDEATLTVISASSDLTDDFDPSLETVHWASFSDVVFPSAFGGSVSAPNSLWFGGEGERFAETRALNTLHGGRIDFQIRFGDGSNPNWQPLNTPFEYVVLEFQVPGETNWIVLGRFDSANLQAWTRQQFPIPPSAQSPATRFRWRQPDVGLFNRGHWAIDNVEIRLGPYGPLIVREPENRIVAQGATAFVAVGAFGTEPLAVRWYFQGMVLPVHTNLTLSLPNLMTNQAGEYFAVIENNYGSVTSAVATLSVYVPPAEDFRILSLSSNGAVTAGHSNLTGFPLSTIAVTPARVLVSGFDDTARFSAHDLSGGTLLNRNYYYLVNDLRAETAYTLGDGTNVFDFDEQRITSLLELDGLSGLPTGRRIALSEPIQYSGSFPLLGLYAGYGRIVIQEQTRVRSVELPSGQVVDFGEAPLPRRFGTLGYNGLAEFFDGSLHLVTVRDSNTVVRTRVSDGAVTELATFANLGGMAVFSAAIYENRWYFQHSGESQFGQGDGALVGFAEAQFLVPDSTEPPAIVGQPEGFTTAAGNSASLIAAATGARPLFYQWRFNGVDLAGATNATLRFPSAQTNQTGDYTFVVTNAFGVSTSMTARVRVIFLGTEPFQITSLSVNGAFGVGHEPITGDDRGGIAVSSSRVFVTGDETTGRLALGDLSGGAALANRYDALVSDLKTETVYNLGNGSTLITSAGGTVTTLIELNATTGAATGRRVTLSSPIPLPPANGRVGLFAGYERVVIHNGTRVYNILLPSGAVADLGTMPPPPHRFSESWAYWGVAEFFDGAIHLVYGRDFFTISRTRVPDGATSTLLYYQSLGDIASLTVSPLNDRWYFHYEGSGIIGSGDELVGFAEASFAFNAPPRPPAILSQPTSVTVFEGGSAAFRATVTGSRPLLYQWRRNGVDLPGATNATLTIENAVPSLTGSYSVAVTNELGFVVSNPATLTVRPPLSPARNFRITALLTNGSKVVDHDVLTGDDRGGIAVSRTHVFYTGDSSTARFQAADLSGGTELGQIRDALTGNLRNGAIYTLVNGTTPLGSSGGIVNGLIELDGATGALTTNRINFSRSITLTTDTGIFAGYDRIVLHSAGRVSVVDLPSGQVTDLGLMPALEHSQCENWAYWGVAEQFGGFLYVVYVRDFQTIARTRLPDGLTSTVATFDFLGDMCAFSLSLALNRWYFHHEGSSVFGGTSETIGYAEAHWDHESPVLLPIGDVTTLEDTPVVVPFTVFDAESPATNLTVSAQSSDTNLVPLANITLSADGTNRTATITPAPDANGSAIIHLTLTDQAGFVTTNSFLLTVLPVNDSPVLLFGENPVALEDSGPHSLTAWASITAGPENEGTQSFQIRVTTDNTALFASPPELQADGTLTFTPALNASGVANVTVTVEENGETNNVSEAAFPITILPVNDSPFFIRGPDQWVVENGCTKSVPRWATGITAGPPDEATQQTQFIVVSDNPSLFSALPMLTPAGELHFSTALGVSGEALVSVTLRDDGGIEHGGQDTSPVQTFRISVRSINARPIARSQTVSTTEETPVSIRLSAFDVDRDPLTWNVGAPAHGTLTGQAPQLTYTPDTDYTGTDSFTFTVHDGVTNSQTALVTIQIAPAADRPIADAGATELTVISANSSNALVVLDGSLSSDPDGDALEHFWSIDGSAVPAASGVRVTNVLFVGSHQITLLVDDGTASDAEAIEVRVITASKAVEEISRLVDEAKLDRTTHRRFQSSLKAAAKAFDRRQSKNGLNHLKGFLKHLQSRSRFTPADSTIALQRQTHQVMDALALPRRGQSH